MVELLDSITVIRKNLRNRFRAAEDAEADRAAYRTANDISVASCPKSGPFRYEKQMEVYVLGKYGHYWPKWEHYDNCKSVYNQLVDYGQQKDTPLIWFVLFIFV